MHRVLAHALREDRSMGARFAANLTPDRSELAHRNGPRLGRQIQDLHPDATCER